MNRFDEIAEGVIELEIRSGDCAAVWLTGRDEPLYTGPYPVLAEECEAMRRAIAAALRAAVEGEREACAKVADAFDTGERYDWAEDSADARDDERNRTAEKIAAAIRARGKL